MGENKGHICPSRWVSGCTHPGSHCWSDCRGLGPAPQVLPPRLDVEWGRGLLGQIRSGSLAFEVALHTSQHKATRFSRKGFLREEC